MRYTPMPYWKNVYIDPSTDRPYMGLHTHATRDEAIDAAESCKTRLAYRIKIIPKECDL